MPPKRKAPPTTQKEDESDIDSSLEVEVKKSKKAPAKGKGKKKAKGDKLKDPRHAVIAEFQKAVAERKAAMDAIGDERAAHIHALLNSINTLGLGDKDLNQVLGCFQVRSNAITKAASLLQPVRFDEGAKALGVAKMYYDSVRPRMLAATRRGVYNELERTVRRTASDADIKRRARDMINHMRGAMRAAAGDGGSRSRRYSEGNA